METDKKLLLKIAEILIGARFDIPLLEDDFYELNSLKSDLEYELESEESE